MLKKMQGPSDTYRDVFEPGWREKEAERDRMLQAAFEKVPMSNPADELTRLRAEAEALRADAGRYRWLRPMATSSTEQRQLREGRCYVTVWHIVTGGSDFDIDAAIAAAIAKAEAGNG